MRSSLIVTLLFAAACSRPAAVFNDTNASAHVTMLAGTIGSRPVGTPANAQAREYIVDQLRQIGFDVRVQETDARRHELGRTARVSNIIGILPGAKPDAIGLVSHYDSSPDAPGATDDGLGVAVTLEAARVLSAGERRQWTLMALVTDGEEAGLMGAAGLVTDREVMNRLRAYLNIESIGSSGTAVLFETGPANAWLVSPWARSAPYPRGGSYGIEVYRRLPNDTDFSLLKTREIPGLNFAAVGDSYAYHTARDTPERLSRETLRTTGENVVAVATRLQQMDINLRSPDWPTFMDINVTTAVTYGPSVMGTLSMLALVTGVIGWVRVTAVALRLNGVWRWILSIVWAWLGAVVVAASMVGATWLVRVAREVYHPWYARPGRLFLLLLATGAASAWGMSRGGVWLPKRAHPVRHQAITWSATLPVWIVLAAGALWFAPAAAYLWMLPLLAAGLVTSAAPVHHDWIVRIGSILVLAVSATLWLRESAELLRFIVAIMGRLPIVTPVFVYAAVISAAAMMVAPPLVAIIASERPLGNPWAITAGLLFAVAIAIGAVYLAPAYTNREPLRRSVRALQDGDAPNATWEVASVEPGLDLGPGAPGGWTLATDTVTTSGVPLGRYGFPFVFRATGPSLGAAPASVSGFSLTPLPEGTRVTLSVTPKQPGVAVTFVLPQGVTPARSSLPGIVRNNHWIATYIAIPPEGIAWDASFHKGAERALPSIRLAVSSSRLPGGDGWQSLPHWLPQDMTVWSATATWVLPAQVIAPVPPLR
jgi:peptidase M28-like protein